MKILKRGKELQEFKAKYGTEHCPLCEREMYTILSKNHVVDHDHNTGKVRGILCRNCNGLLGKIEGLCVRAGNYIDNNIWLGNILGYLEFPQDIPEVYYPGTKVVKGKIIPPPKIKRRRKKNRWNT